MNNPFTVNDFSFSHSVEFKIYRENFLRDAQSCGQLLVCQSGEIEIIGRGSGWVLPADHMIYLPGNETFRICSSIPSSGLVINFCRKEIAVSYDNCRVVLVNDIATYLTNYSLKWSPEKVRNEGMAKALFITLGEMVREWFQANSNDWVDSTLNASIQKVMDLARRVGPGISLLEAADHVGMCERTLRRHLQTELGQSWREFIREQRMNKAMELLRTERKSITETAFDVGFSSSSAFSSAFFKYVGKTPSTFMRRAKNYS